MSFTIATQHLTKDYGVLRAIDDLSFTAASGEIIALLGPNGAGKSTLMNMITGYLAPTSGNIFVLGRNIRNDALFAKTSIGFLPEGAPLYPDMTVGNFLRYMAELRGLPAAQVTQAAEIANITQVMQQKIETLSKGYLRRVGFAQSILSNPPILLLDEPTNHLDSQAISFLENYLKGYKNALIVVSHDRYFIDVVSNKIIEIENGKSHSYNCRYEEYSIQKRTQRAIDLKHYINQQKEIKKIQEERQK